MDEYKEKIRTFLSRFFRARNLNDDDDIFALGFVNSLFAMQLVMWVEKEFAIQVEDEDLEISNFNSVNAIAALAARKSGNAPGNAALLNGVRVSPTQN
jgi:methoxymalonate biosynthesis acyl carrier protein